MGAKDNKLTRTFDVGPDGQGKTLQYLYLQNFLRFGIAATPVGLSLGAGNNLTFTDPVAGTITLAGLIAGGGPWDRNVGGWTYLDNVGDTVTIGDALTHPEKLYVSGRLQMPAVADPALTGASGKIYLKTVGPRIELCYMDDAGNITQITGAGTLVHSLDQAYDDGSIITVDGSVLGTNVDWQLTDTFLFQISSVVGGADNILSVDAEAAGDRINMGSATNPVIVTKWGSFNIIPDAAGANGLVINDNATGLLNMLILKEDGSINMVDDAPIFFDTAITQSLKWDTLTIPARPTFAFSGPISTSSNFYISPDVMIYLNSPLDTAYLYYESGGATTVKLENSVLGGDLGFVASNQIRIIASLSSIQFTPGTFVEIIGSGILNVTTQINVPLVTIDSSDLTLSTTTTGDIVLTPIDGITANLTNTNVFQILNTTTSDSIFNITAGVALGADVITMGSVTNAITFTKWGDFNVNGGDIILNTGNVTATLGTLTGVTVSDGAGCSMSAGTFTDGTASLTAGTYTGLVSLTSTTLTDGTASLSAGTFTGLVSLTSTTLTDGTASLSAGTFTGLVSLTSTTITDGTASLSAGTFTGLVSLTSTTLTDGTASLSAGTFTGLVSVTSTTLTDGAGGTITGGTVTGVSLTDSTATLTTGLFTGLVSVTSTTFTDGTATLTAGGLTGIVNIGGQYAAFSNLVATAQPVLALTQANVANPVISILANAGTSDISKADTNMILDITIGAGVARPVDYQLRYDGATIAGLRADTDAAGALDATTPLWQVPYYSGDYGAGWGTAPTPNPTNKDNGCMFLAHNTNGAGSDRLYGWTGGAWKSVQLS